MDDTFLKTINTNIMFIEGIKILESNINYRRFKPTATKRKYCLNRSWK